MRLANVIFKFGTKNQFDALLTKDSNTLYWLYDVLQLYKGDLLFGVGALASDQVAGLMSPEDKAKLDRLTNVGVGSMTALDAAIRLESTSGGFGFGINISAVEGNALTLREDGLFVPVIAQPLIPEYSIEKQAEADADASATYRLKRVCGDEVTYVGDAINIPNDLVVQSGVLETVIIADQPYIGAKVGDPYIDLVLSDAAGTHIYIPVKELVDVPVAGTGIAIVDDTIALKLNPVNANGLFVNDDGLGLGLATKTNAGAMSADDKMALDAAPVLYEHVKYEIVNIPAGTLVDYRDKEIRVMFPKDTDWARQEIGQGGDGDKYYFALRAYAPSNDVVAFRADDQDTIEDPTLYAFDGELSGVDEYGRKYSTIWLPAAAYDAESDSWHYLGDQSDEKMIGWDYSVEWYDTNDVMLGADKIRINLSNEACHFGVEPYFMNTYAFASEVEDLQAAVSAAEESFTWGDM